MDGQKDQAPKKQGFWKNPLKWVANTIKNQDSPKGKDQNDESIINLNAFVVKNLEDSIVVTKRNIKESLEFRKLDKNFQPITPQDVKNKKPKLISKQTFSALLGIIQIEESCFLLAVKKCRKVASLWGHSIYEIKGVKFIPFTRKSMLEKNSESISEQINQITRLFKGGWYFSGTYNLWKPIQYQDTSEADCDYSHFIWNSLAIESCYQFWFPAKWCKSIVQGFVGQTPSGPGDKWNYNLVTRKSKQMGGTRFYARGINDFGYVANYCETEEIILTSDQVFSHVQVRGSVPLYWQQAGPVHPPMLSTSLETSKGPFLAHMNWLEKLYGPIWACNLLSTTKSGEPDLSQGWKSSIANNG
jgi:hypothetical protein